MEGQQDTDYLQNIKESGGCISDLRWLIHINPMIHYENSLFPIA